MPKYKISENKQGLKIDLTELAGSDQELLSEFEKCQRGQCSCPTNEYQKLESIQLEQGEDLIQIQLTAKDDQKLDKAEIIKCLEHTTKISTSGE